MTHSDQGLKGVLTARLSDRSVCDVLVITQLYRPEPNFITADVAEMLARHVRVTVVTTHPSYPLGRFYDSVTSIWPKKTENGNLTVWRLPIIPDQSTSVRRRAASYISFALLAALFAPFASRKPDVVWVYNTPFTVAVAAWWYRMRGARIVFTAADLWPESFTAAGVMSEGPLIRALYAYRRWANRLADLVVCATEGTVRRYIEDGYPPSQLVHVPVWVDVPPNLTGAATITEPEPARLVYAGNLGPGQQLDTIIRAAALLEDQGHLIQVDMYGAGGAEAELRDLAASIAPNSVTFHGRVPPAQAFRELASATGQLVSLRRSPEFANTVPSKLYGTFAAGTPLLFGLEGDARDIALRSGGGIEFDPASPESLADAIQRLLALGQKERTAMRSRLLELYRSRYERDVLLERYRRIILGSGPDHFGHSVSATSHS